MKRKYVYIITFLLIIIAVIADNYVILSLNNRDVSNLDATNSLEPNIFDDNKFDDIANNALLKSSISISNYQDDNEIINYLYKLRIDGIYGAYKYSKNDLEGFLVFSANGEAEFNLNSNEKITIYDIPTELEYRLEQVTDVGSKYSTKINDTLGRIEIGTISLENNITVFNNLLDTSVKIEEPKDEDNPYTADSFYYILGSLIILAFLLLILLRIKVKRFL